MSDLSPESAEAISEMLRLTGEILRRDELLDRLAEGLAKYGRHPDDCGLECCWVDCLYACSGHGDHLRCTCGLDALLAARPLPSAPEGDEHV